MERDLSIIVPEQTLSVDVSKQIKKVGKGLIEEVDLIDRYAGNNIADGKVSMTFRIRYRKKDATLTDSDITPTHKRIIDSLTDIFTAEQRI